MGMFFFFCLIFQSISLVSHTVFSGLTNISINIIKVLERILVQLWFNDLFGDILCRHLIICLELIIWLLYETW